MRRSGGRGIHVDRQIRAGGGVVEERPRPVTMQQDRNLVDVGDDPRDVRGRREAADLHPTVGVTRQLTRQMLEIHSAVAIKADSHELDGRLAPRQLVGVMLVGPDEHHRPFPPIELEYAEQPVDRGGRARAAEQHDVILTAVHRLVDDRPRLLAPRRRTPTGRRRLGMRVAIHR